MTERFKTYLAEKHLISDRPALIGVSGGRDSMVLCHLYLSSGIPFAIAHCNFKLRAEESDADEAFVKNWADKHQIVVHIKSFDTAEFAQQNGISIQMAARELRVTWFEQLCSENNYEFYATAHHQDDAIETYLINQIRGTGLAGLHGILPRQGQLIHPMLFCGREEITYYAQNTQINWREDSSNKENKYLRNKVRNQLIPLLKEINPEIHSILVGNTKRLKASEEIYLLKIEEYKNQICTPTNSGFSIDLKQLQNIPQKDLVLFEIINDFGFNYSQASQILTSDKTKSGSLMESSSHILLKNRDELILKGKEEKSKAVYSIDQCVENIHKPIQLLFNYQGQKEVKKEESIGQFDYHLLKFPLVLRKWKEADFFYPLGMKGKKKRLSDFFIDEKMSIFDKNKCWLLCSGSNIIWVVGKRMDERFKISNDTKQVLEIRWMK
jgi:tRNA(Ile)-lysidine synthase